MRLTPPTNLTFGIGIIFGIAGLGLGLYQGISSALTVALAGLIILAIGNLYEKI